MNEITGYMVAFNVRKKLTANEFNKFCRQLYGYIDRSRHGFYKYKRKGLFDEIPNIKIGKSVYIIKEEDVAKLAEFLDSYGADKIIRKIYLEEDDITQLYPNKE